MSDVKRTDFSTPWSNQEDIKQGIQINYTVQCIPFPLRKKNINSNELLVLNLFYLKKLNTILRFLNLQNYRMQWVMCRSLGGGGGFRTQGTQGQAPRSLQNADFSPFTLKFYMEHTFKNPSRFALQVLSSSNSLVPPYSRKV